MSTAVSDDHVLQQAEAGHHIDHPLAGGRLIGVATDAGPTSHHEGREDRGTGTGTGDDDAISIAQPDALHHVRANEQLD
jgi:hypothetical protein